MSQLKELKEKFDAAAPGEKIEIQLEGKTYTGEKGKDGQENILNLTDETGHHIGYIDFIKEIVFHIQEHIFESLINWVTKVFKKKED